MLLKFFPIYTAIVLAGCAVTFARAEDTPTNVGGWTNRARPDAGRL